MHRRYGLTFDSEGSWSFGNVFARNVIIFGADNCWSFHVDNRKNNFLALRKGPIYGISGSFGLPENKFSISFNKTNTIFFLSLHYNTDNNYLFVNEKKSVSLKPIIKVLIFQLNFVSETYPMN